MKHVLLFASMCQCFVMNIILLVEKKFTTCYNEQMNFNIGKKYKWLMG